MQGCIHLSRRLVSNEVQTLRRRCYRCDLKISREVNAEIPGVWRAELKQVKRAKDERKDQILQENQ